MDPNKLEAHRGSRRFHSTRSPAVLHRRPAGLDESIGGDSQGGSAIDDLHLGPTTLIAAIRVALPEIGRRHSFASPPKHPPAATQPPTRALEPVAVFDEWSSCLAVGAPLKIRPRRAAVHAPGVAAVQRSGQRGPQPSRAGTAIGSDHNPVRATSLPENRGPSSTTGPTSLVKRSTTRASTRAEVPAIGLRFSGNQHSQMDNTARAATERARTSGAGGSDGSWWRAC